MLLRRKKRKTRPLGPIIFERKKERKEEKKRNLGFVRGRKKGTLTCSPGDVRVEDN